MTTALCPGSFDPPTNGHIDVIRRSVSIFDKVVVAVIRNPSKSPMFTAEERVEMLRELFADEPKVEVDSFAGLLVDFANERGDIYVGEVSYTNWKGTHPGEATPAFLKSFQKLEKI